PSASRFWVREGGGDGLLRGRFPEVRDASGSTPWRIRVREGPKIPPRVRPPRAGRGRDDALRPDPSRTRTIRSRVYREPRTIRSRVYGSPEPSIFYLPSPNGNQ